MVEHRPYLTVPITTTKEGVLVCDHCGRVFDTHPSETRRKELHAQLCAIEDDDRAARAFHHHRASQAHADSMAKFWTGSIGFSMYELGYANFEGVRFTLEPGVSPDRMIAEIDSQILPALRKHMVDALDGTRDREAKEFEAKLAANEITVTKYDPTWCPDTPTVQELYPHGYVRHADGSVEAKE